MSRCPRLTASSSTRLRLFVLWDLVWSVIGFCDISVCAGYVAYRRNRPNRRRCVIILIIVVYQNWALQVCIIKSLQLGVFWCSLTPSEAVRIRLCISVKHEAANACQPVNIRWTMFSYGNATRKRGRLMAIALTSSFGNYTTQRFDRVSPNDLWWTWHLS